MGSDFLKQFGGRAEESESGNKLADYYLVILLIAITVAIMLMSIGAEAIMAR